MFHLFRIFTLRPRTRDLQVSRVRVLELQTWRGLPGKSHSETFSSSYWNKSPTFKTSIICTWAKTCLLFFLQNTRLYWVGDVRRDSRASGGGGRHQSQPAAHWLPLCSSLLTASRTLALRTADRRCCYRVLAVSKHQVHLPWSSPPLAGSMALHLTRTTPHLTPSHPDKWHCHLHWTIPPPTAGQIPSRNR